MEFLLISFIIIVVVLFLLMPKNKKYMVSKEYSRQNKKNGNNYEVRTGRHYQHHKQPMVSKDYAEQNKQKGDKYELQIGKYYQQLGYKVYFKGIKEGLKDQGIDLIAYKGKETLLIQCKNWQNSQVKQEHLRLFLGDCTAYLEKNHNIFAKKKVKRVFVTSCKNIDYGVQKFVEENNVEYKIIPYNHR
ncbi:MAG: restriction endonuclease [Helicobacter trogontum]|uniref:Restriction endonuclease type IV Mrr domain-containing protein n=2 Tax=Helicobacter trogontum TaxID=50960 RepID=A0A4U8TEF5_9HELI|nr:restriction endonuclease [Helicobacter trogontum]MCI5786060.1 restriction endonuclease [Helicobacter trogontum]TLD98084.1 hypothetical protein LS80_006000 [Helicobacter trogontum]